MTSNELRKKFIEFYIKKDHKEIQAVPLLAQNDPSLLFVNSGMFPLVPYLAGQAHPQGKKLVNCQRSFRTEDIEEIGDHRHDTLFEMLGVWSLGDYFKEEHLNNLYEFLIEEIKLDPKRIYQTVFAGSEYAPKDLDAIEILKNVFKKYGINAEVGPETLGKGDMGSGQEIEFGGKIKIFPYRDKNWWKRGDAVGELGGPDSETFYDTGRPHNEKFGKFCHLNCDCGRFIEIGNSVFMEYIKTENGWEKRLPQRNVDFGGGFERLVMVANNKTNIFETDVFDYLIKFLEDRSGKNYQDFAVSFEIIADHMRAVTFLIADGGIPSNKDQGYIVRRLIRRTLVHFRKIGVDFKEAANLSELVISYMSDVYPYLETEKEGILVKINTEVKKFSLTYERAMKEFERVIRTIIIDGKLSDEEKKKRLELAPKELPSSAVFELVTTFGFPIELVIEEAKEKGLVIDLVMVNSMIKKHQELSRKGAEHKFKGGLADTNEQTTKYHTATHLLLESLRRVLGPDVFQRGSNITGERMRFDFSYPEKMTKEQIQKVEDLVNEQIQKDLPVSLEEMSLDDAKRLGAMGIFESKYGERVKVYTIGAPSTDSISSVQQVQDKSPQAGSGYPFSREICGGPHVANTGILGKFKIKKEEASSSGVRRIKAVLE